MIVDIKGFDCQSIVAATMGASLVLTRSAVLLLYVFLKKKFYSHAYVDTRRLERSET